MDQSQRTGPLDDLTIIDCTMALAGPFGTALLADLGANVIKIEPPQGDALPSAAALSAGLRPRGTGPSAASTTGPLCGGESQQAQRLSRPEDPGLTREVLLDSANRRTPSSRTCAAV